MNSKRFKSVKNTLNEIKNFLMLYIYIYLYVKENYDLNEKICK